MKSDRQTYMPQYSPSGGLARWIYGGLPLARGDTGSESIARLICHCERWCCLPTRSRSYLYPDKKSGEGSAIVNQILRPLRTGLRMTDSLRSGPPIGKPSAGFSESDVGEQSSAECDVGRTLDELVSSELETTRLTDEEICNGYCLTMDSIRFQLCQN